MIGWVRITVHSSTESGPALHRMCSGIPTLPMSWRKNPYPRVGERASSGATRRARAIPAVPYVWKKDPAPGGGGPRQRGAAPPGEREPEHLGSIQVAAGRLVLG